MDGCRSSADFDHRQRVGPKLPAAHHLHRSVRTKSDDRAQAGCAHHNQFARMCLQRSRCSQKTCRGDRDRIGSSGSSGDNRWPGGPRVEILPLQGEAFRQRATSGVQQISQTESCLERARKRLTAHDEARQALVTDVEESEARLERLRAAAVAAESVPLPRSSSEVQNQVQNLQQRVNQLQEERDALARELQGALVERQKVRQRLSHAFGRSQRLDARTPRRVARSNERRTLFEGARTDIDVVERCREDVRDDRRHDVLIDESRSHSRYGCTLDRPDGKVQDRLRAEM